MDQLGHPVLLRSNQPGAADRMRELLARTVQEHVSDEQSTAGALEDIRQRMEGLEGLVKELRDRELPGLTSVGDTVGQVLDALRAQDERFTKLQHSLGQLHQHIETTTERLDQRLAGTDTRVTALDARLERLDERLDDQYDRVSAIDNTLAAIDTKLGAIGGALARTDTRISGTEATLMAVDTKLGALDTTMERVDGRLGEHGQAITSVDGRVGTLGGRLDGLDGRLAGVGARIDGLGEKFDVTAHLGALEETILTLAEALLRPPARVVAAARAAARG